MIERPDLMRRIQSALDSSPVAAILGPRQCGKTTIARRYAETREASFYDLEDPADETALLNPMLALAEKKGLVVVVEVQRRPELLPALRVLVDRPGNKARFLLLGSASPALVKGVSESLAGRIAFVDMRGFDLGEIGNNVAELWVRGGFPRSYLADSDEASFSWRRDFVRTFLERDIPQLGISIPASALARFWTMIAHYHGQVANWAALGRSMGLSEKTVKRYFEILEGSYVARVLPPWSGNLGKRLVKAPKLFIRDSGLLHCLLGLTSFDQLYSHPKVGASWEGFILEEILARWPDAQAFFYATHGGAGLDLLLVRGGRRYGFAMKMNQAPGFTRSMGVASADLGLERLFVVYPGEKSYALDERTEVVPISRLPAL